MEKEAAANLITSDSPLDIDLEDNNEEVSGLLIQDPTGIGVNGQNENGRPAADNTPIVIEPLVLAEGQQVFDFDEISDTTLYEQFGGQQIGDFFWSDSWHIHHKDGVPGSGYEYGNVSQPYSGFNGFGNPVSITSEEDFTFNSAYLTAAWTDGLTIDISGHRDGSQIYSTQVTLDNDFPNLNVFNWIDVDELRFEAIGGTDWFVIDDLVYTPEDQEPGSISGYKWNDLDGDGIWDNDEEGLEDWTIYIDENNNGELDEGETSTVTDEDGYYSFDDLSPGTYTIAEVLQSGWEQTYPGFGDEETVIIDFESLEHQGNIEFHGFNYQEDGFALDNFGSLEFATFGTLESRFSGSTALFNDTINGVTRLSATDNKPFDLVSIDLTELNGSNVADVTFVGELEGGGTVSQTFTLDGNAFDPQTFVFNNNFNEVVSVEWEQESPFHQFDNITIDIGNTGSSASDEAETSVRSSSSLSSSEANSREVSGRRNTEDESETSASASDTNTTSENSGRRDTEDTAADGSGAAASESDTNTTSEISGRRDTEDAAAKESEAGAGESDTNTTESNRESQTAFVENQVIVQIAEGTEASALEALKAEVGATTIKATQTMGMELWSIDGDVQDTISRYENDPRIEFIEPNFIVSNNATFPNEPSFEELWGLHNTAQTGGTSDADIDAPEAWDIQTGSNNVVVGVIDTGIDYTHPDLANNMWTNPGEIANNGIDDDGNGYVDDVYGYDFAYGDSDPFDGESHGTHVAGTIAADGDNGIGVVGVNWDADLMALKFLDDNGSGSTFNAILAIEYATMMGADLTNNSWGGGGFSQGLYNAIAAAGAADSLFVAAAGNTPGNNNDIFPSYPASYDLDNIIAVASTDHNDNLSIFSSIGPTSVDLGAPGSSIYSTIPGDAYGYKSGTSMATPHVSGVASLLLAENPDLSHEEVKEIILESADPITALNGITVTGARLNAFNALSSLVELPGTHTVELGEGENVEDINFGNRNLNQDTGSISGYKWHDLDGNGVWDDEEPVLEGWTIYIDDNENGELDEGETSTVTDENGFYIFEDLDPETYRVAEVIEDGWEQTYPGVGSEIVFEADFSDDDGNPDVDGFTIDNSGAPDEGLWHLSTRRGSEPGHSAEDSMYYGIEETGDYDAGDTAGRIISPVIDLTGLDSAELSFNYFLETEDLAHAYDTATVLISENGGSFVPIASNAVELEDPTTGWTNATFDLSSYVGEEIEISFDFKTGDGAVNDFEGWLVDDVKVEATNSITYHTVELDDGENVEDINFGNRNLNQDSGSISGYKWHDLNGDSQWNNDEPVLEGWTIYIDDNENGELDEGETSTVTDADGYYEFDSLDAGTYVIGEVIPEGWKQTYPDSVVPEAEVETSERSQSSLSSSETDTRKVSLSKDTKDAVPQASVTESDNDRTQENRDSEIPLETAFESGEVIVKLSKDTDISSLNSLKASLGATTINTTKTDGDFADIQLWSINGNVEDVIARNRNNPLLEYIEPNYIITVDSTVPNDPSLDELWGLNNTGQTGGTSDADIDAAEAWDIQTGSNNVVVGVIDTGIDYTHPDLADNMWVNTGEIADNGIDDDGNGYVDDVYGYDFAYGDSDPLDVQSHGTHVAGTIGADGDNGLGVVGVNWDADLMALKFLDDNGSGSTFNAILAIEYATMMGADLTNNSWGGGGFSQGLYDAIAAAGAADSLFIAAAGNDYGNDNDISPSYPASYDLENIIAVASTDHNDHLSGFSNYGATSVDLGAPGSDVYSTIPGGGYARFSGTSMATPHVSGVAALVLAENPDLSYEEVKEIILDSTDPISSLNGITVTGGRLNAFNAISSVGIPGTHTVELDAGENVTDINFGNQEIIPGSISGFKWHDLDEDGIWDNNEEGLEGWTIYIDDNENGEFDEGENSTLTNENGFYIFEDLDPETYRVAEVIEDGWEQTYPGVGSEIVFEADFSDDDGNPDLDSFTVDNTGAPDEGLWHLSTRRRSEPGHSAEASMYYGIEETGNYDAGDTAGRIISPVIDLTGLESAQLSFNYFLETEGSAPIYDAATVLISENGGDFVPIGSNPVQLIDPTTGWTNAKFDLSSYVGEEIEISFDFKTGDGIANQFEGWLVDDVIVGTAEGDPYHTVEVGNGEDIENIDFGNQQLSPGSISGYKWNDLDGDGIWDDDEDGLEDWTIFLDDNENGELDEGEISTFTDAEGFYSFDVDAGTYTVAEEQQPNWKQTYPLAPGEYEWTEIEFDWIDISDVGTPLGFSDDDYAEVLLPFDFPFYGEEKSTVKISSNGYLTFGSDGFNFVNEPIPNPNEPNDLIAPFWDDLLPENGGEVYYYYDENEEQFIVQYQNIPNIDESGDYTFEAILKPDGSIIYQYETLNGILDSNTIGIENGDGSEGLQISYNDGYAEEGLAVQIDLGSEEYQPHIVSVGGGEEVTDINFGNQENLPGSISGYKWNDLDSDGIWDNDEEGLEDWTIFLDDNNNGQLDDGEISTVTDEDGSYSFDVEPGTYNVVEELQDEWEQTYPSQLGVIFEADFSDDDENPDLDGFTVDNTGAANDGLWHLSTRRGNESGHSGVDSMYYGIEEDGNYDAGDTAGRIISPIIDLNRFNSAQLSFNYFLETEGLAPEYDVATVLVSADGGEFIPIASNALELEDPATGWTNANFDLSSYVGQQIEISFEFDSGDRAFNEFEGWYIDDVTVTASENNPYHTVEVGSGQNIEDINFGNFSLEVELPLTIVEEEGTAVFVKNSEDNTYWIVNNQTEEQLQLQNNQGQTYTDSSNPNWDGVAVEVGEDGYRFLLDGENNREGEAYIWNTNDQGVITDRSGWQSGDALLPLEEEFNVDLNDDAIIGFSQGIENEVIAADGILF